jgi:hypothetical protein
MKIIFFSFFFSYKLNVKNVSVNTVVCESWFLLYIMGETQAEDSEARISIEKG